MSLDNLSVPSKVFYHASILVPEVSKRYAQDSPSLIAVSPSSSNICAELLDKKDVRYVVEESYAQDSTGVTEVVPWRVDSGSSPFRAGELLLNKHWKRTELGKNMSLTF